jgi:hypothetical protein
MPFAPTKHYMWRLCISPVYLIARKTAVSTINYQLLTINYQLLTINYQITRSFPPSIGICAAVVLANKSLHNSAANSATE